MVQIYSALDTYNAFNLESGPLECCLAKNHPGFGRLGGEANSPGTFSRKTVNLLADLGKRDTELFTYLCGFGWVIGDFIPLVFNWAGEIYERHNISFRSLSHLQTLGLVQFNHITGFARGPLSKKITVSYHGKSVELTLPNDADNSLELGQVLLTDAGQELARVCDSTPIEGFFDFVYDMWASQSYVPKRGTEPKAASPAAACTQRLPLQAGRLGLQKSPLPLAPYPSSPPCPESQGCSLCIVG